MRIRSVFAPVVALLLLSAVTASTASAARYDVEIRRTAYGIPHIKADDYGSLGYGYGYAFAEDNICTIADEYVTVRGERSRYFGPDAKTIPSAKSSDNNLDSDFLFQSYRDRKVVEKLIKLKPPMGPKPEVRAAIKGYVAGYNRYLKDTGVKRIPDKRCKGKPWVKPITELDAWSRAYQLALIAGSLQFTSGLTNVAPPGSTQGAPKVSEPLPTSREAASYWENLRNVERTGSNGIGLGSQGTASGNGMVLANPHFPWYGGERFYQFQYTLPGKASVQGASLYGVPVVNVGFNEHVAWTHTVSTAWRFTPFRLQLVPGDPTSYVVDGKPEKMTSRTVKVKTNKGTETRTLWYSRYGQIGEISQAGYTWTNEFAYAIGDVNAENMRIANVWFDMNHAKNVDDLIKAQSDNQGVPWVNTMAADDRGVALYTDNSVVPHVTDQQLADCIPAGLPQVVRDAAGVITLDGARSACAWGSDADAVVKGIFGPKKLPIMKRRDYVQNSNDSFWLSNAKAPITGIPAIVGDVNTEQNLRTRFGLREITDRLADGKGFTIAELRSMWSGAGSEGARYLKDGLADLCAANPSVTVDGAAVDISAACPVLRAWDGTGRLNSKGSWLFTLWWRYSDKLFADTFDPANPVTTPNTFAATPANAVALGKAVKEMRDQGIPLDASQGDVQFRMSRGKKIPIPGCNMGCYLNISATNDPKESSEFVGFPVEYGEVLDGSSTVQTIELTKKGPKGGTILTYSESENESSPRWGDQTALFSQSKWVPLTFTEKQIAADKRLKTTRLRGKD